MLDDLVLFIDGEAIVLDKPAGLPVDPPRDGSPSIVARADELRFTFQREPTPVHRLDRDTSGCLLLARNPKAHARFQQAFEQGRVTKRYLAILDGVPDAESGEIDLPLAKVSTAEAGWRMVGDRRGKAARTNWRLLRVADGRALVALFPETGRTHQIRVHMAEGLGCPVAGDPVYGCGGGAMLLHAAGLLVPRDNKPAIDVTAPWPRSFAAAGFDEGLVPRIPTTRSIAIDSGELVESFTRASGPGGQHVNTTDSAVLLRFDVAASPGLPDAVKARLAVLAGSRLTKDGVLTLRADASRSQEMNRREVRDRLFDLIREATIVPKKRRATKPTKASQVRRVDAKKGRSQVKAGRGRVRVD